MVSPSPLPGSARAASATDGCSVAMSLDAAGAEGSDPAGADVGGVVAEDGAANRSEAEPGPAARKPSVSSPSLYAPHSSRVAGIVTGN